MTLNNVRNAVLVAAIWSVSAASTASAGIQLASFGTAGPSSTVGGFTMQAFGSDPRPVFDVVTGVDVANGSPFGEITFSSPLSHRRIGDGWNTWSHGYTGDVYFAGANSVTVTLAPQTGAFYLYIEPNNFGLFSFTVTCGTAEFMSQAEGSSGAAGVAFYTDDGSALPSITISFDPGANGFAIGEFGAALVPAPGAIAAFGLAGLVRSRRRRA